MKRSPELVFLRKPVLLLVLCLALLLPGIQPASGATQEGWQSLASGIDYQEFSLSGPNKVYVARMDRSNPNVTLETTLAKGRLGSREKISAQYQRYDQTINTWGEWGNRSQAVVAINGSYENAIDNTTIFPQSGVVQSGWYVFRYLEHEPSGFAWWPDRSAFIGGCISHGSQQTITLPDDTRLTIDRLNSPRGSDELVLYTPQYNSTTLTDEYGTEVVVQLDRPASIQLYNQSPVGTVVEIRKDQGSTPIPFDSVVISASGDAAAPLNTKLNVGDQVRIWQRVRRCTVNLDEPPLENTYSGLTGDFHFLENGKIIYFPDKPAANVPDSHTAIAFNDQYVYFIVNDGPNPTLPKPGDRIIMKGMTITELARFAKDQLQAREAIAEDSGGSSTMVVNGVVRNFPTDGIPRGPQAAGSSLYLPLIHRRDALPTPVPRPTPLPTPNPAIVERPVINGMMMVAVQPKEQSPRFSTGQQVIVTQENTFLRLGPGDNYGLVALLSRATSGEILSHPLQGVQARWTYWWKVDFGGVQGWVADEALTAAP